MTTITIVEPVPACHSVKHLEGASGLPMDRLGDAIGHLLDVQRSVQGDEVTLHPGTTIGTVQVGELRINVKPRLVNADMARLIRYAYGSDFEPVARSQIDTGYDGLDELLCRVLADELDMIRRRGVSRLYVDRREPMAALRGRVDFLASFPWNDRGMTTLTCRYHELSCDNLDNQLVLAGLDETVLLHIHPVTRTRLTAHRHAWHELVSKRPVSLYAFPKARSKYNRLTEHYRLAHHVCEAIMSRLRPQSLFNGGALATAGVSVDMAELFELAVYRLLREALEPAGYSIRYQRTDTHALRDAEGGRYRSIRPDILVFEGSTPLAVIDAKYKDYWEAEPTNLAPIRKVGNDDIYQLFFYASRLQNTYGLPSPLPAVIVSPMPDDEELCGRSVISDRYKSIELNVGDVTNRLVLSLLPLSSIIRKVASATEWPQPAAAFAVVASNLPQLLKDLKA